MTFLNPPKHALRAARFTLALTAFALTGAITGCEKSEESKPAKTEMKAVTPADAPTSAPVAASDSTAVEVASGAAPAAPGKRESAGGVSWEMPAGWSRGAEASMRLATVGDGTAEIAISAFGGNVGGILPNINRWRGQVGLAPVASEADAEKSITDVDVAGVKIRVVDLVGSSRMLVAMVPGNDKLFFFKMTAAPEVAAAKKPAFDQLVKSIKLD